MGQGIGHLTYSDGPKTPAGVGGFKEPNQYLKGRGIRFYAQKNFFVEDTKRIHKILEPKSD